MPTTWAKSKKPAIAAKVREKIICKLCSKKFSLTAFCRHLTHKHLLTPQDYYLKFIDNNGDKCLCGCGSITSWTNLVGGRFVDYVKGHNIKNVTAKTSDIVKRRSKSIKKSWDENRHKGGFRDIIVRKKSAISRSKTMKLLYANGKLVLPNMKISSNDRRIAQQKAYETICASHKPPGSWSTIKHGWYLSNKLHRHVYYQSGWELQYMKELDENQNVIWWEHPGPKISYYDSDSSKMRFYYPDFLVTFYNNCDHLIEIKGQLTKLDITKIQAGKKYAEQKDLNFSVLSYHKPSKTFYEREINT